MDDPTGAPPPDPADVSALDERWCEQSRNNGYHMATRMRVLAASGDYVDSRVNANAVERHDGVWFVLGVRSVGDEDGSVFYALNRPLAPGMDGPIPAQRWGAHQPPRYPAGVLQATSRHLIAGSVVQARLQSNRLCFRMADRAVRLPD
ncbi:MAG: hypothetical protein ACK5O2_10720 [Microthrixaceae bacterium]